MKKLNVLFGLIVSLAMASCTRIEEKTAKEMLERSNFRSEVFDEIIGNDKYLNEFTDKIASTEGGKRMCTMNVPMLRMAWESDKMDSMINADRIMMETMVNRVVHKMESDTNTCSMMCSKVMENGHLKSYVIKHACGSKEPAKQKK